MAKQFKRANRALKAIRTYLGRVTRDIVRKIKGEAELKSAFAHPLMLARRVREQRQHRRGKKVYSLHAPEVEDEADTAAITSKGLPTRLTSRVAHFWSFVAPNHVDGRDKPGHDGLFCPSTPFPIPPFSDPITNAMRAILSSKLFPGRLNQRHLASDL